MLDKYWRLWARNETGQTLTLADGGLLAVKMTPWKFSSGALVYGTAIDDDIGQTATIIDGATTEGDTQDNRTNLYLGILGTFYVMHDLDAAVGEYRLFYEHCEDDSSWPSDASDAVIEDLIQVCVLNIDNSANDKSRSKNFVL
jgi:hypothetical protein